jgi:hypothetical protein
MFDALTPLGLATLPRQGIGARIVRRLGRVGAALHGVVAGRLRRRPSDPDSHVAPDSPVAPDADTSTAMPARARRQARCTPSGVPERQHDLAFTAAAFPDLSPAAREFFNTPVEDCDPDMLGRVLEALADTIAGMMTPQDGMQDARDVFLALNSRLGALTGGMQGTPPESVPAEPDAAATPADADVAAEAAADPDTTGPQAAAPTDAPATGPQAAAPDMPGSAVTPPDGSAAAQGTAAVATAGSDRPATPPATQPPSSPALIDTGTNTGTNTAQAPHDRRVGPCQSGRRSFRGGRRFAAGGLACPPRTIPFHRRTIVGYAARPPRLLCYAACAGPPALPGAPNQARRVMRDARDHRMVVPRYLIPAA